MAPFLRADIAELLGHAGQLTSACQAIEAGLAELDPGIARLAEEWQGSAAEGFRYHAEAWQRAQRRLLDDLRELRGTLGAAAENYQAAESANADMWSGG